MLWVTPSNLDTDPHLYLTCQFRRRTSDPRYVRISTPSPRYVYVYVCAMDYTLQISVRRKRLLGSKLRLQTTETSQQIRHLHSTLPFALDLFPCAFVDFVLLLFKFVVGEGCSFFRFVSTKVDGEVLFDRHPDLV